ncbi:MAG: T9SS type A sorting domain-containing protein [bacterium]|nr:T9SS type A sorting domain-containing protein [bacterium]
MKIISSVIFVFLSTYLSFGQSLPPKQAYPLNVKQIHSGHSLTDPLFANWPGQYVNLIGIVNALPSWQLFDDMVGKSTIPGSSLRYRWDNPPGFSSPDARNQIADWEVLTITERVPLLYQGGSTQQWYLDGIQEQKNYLSNFVNNAWNNGKNGDGAPTLLWTTWTNIDNSNGPWRQMLDTQGAEFERMQDYANLNRPIGAPPVYIIPGHKLMARIYDDIQLSLVPGITNINELFIDNIHTNSLGNYAIAMIHYACMFNKSPVGLTNDLMPNPPVGFQIPSTALALYLQTVVWEVVTNYPRTGITSIPVGNSEVSFVPNDITIYPNPVKDMLYLDKKTIDDIGQIRVFNAIGTLMYSGNELSIDVSRFPLGIYFLHCKTSIFKLVKLE